MYDKTAHSTHTKNACWTYYRVFQQIQMVTISPPVFFKTCQEKQIMWLTFPWYLFCFIYLKQISLNYVHSVQM